MTSIIIISIIVLGILGLASIFYQESRLNHEEKKPEFLCLHKMEVTGKYDSPNFETRDCLVQTCSKCGKIVKTYI